VSPATTTFDSCFDPTNGNPISALAFPNGFCQTSNTDNVTITTGSQPSTVDVQGSDAVPSDNGTHWTLCGAESGSRCTGPTPLFGAPITQSQQEPGQDQFAEQTSLNGFDDSQSLDFGPPLTTSPQCDTAFGTGSCSAHSSQATTEVLILLGPESSTDASTAFSTTWTWTAAP
jgi:hypothetical protein